jgi:hypothetical protein
MRNTTLVLLLLSHILSGSIALLAAFSALYCVKGMYWHRSWGDIFFGAMTGVLVTAIPLSILRPNLFLFMIAIFSYYLAFSGFRHARNRNSTAKSMDWIASIIMLIVALGMIGYGSWHFDLSEFKPILLLIFGIIGFIFSVGDIKDYLNPKKDFKIRISKHLGAMLGATIAALTAFTVTNVHVQPTVILWLLPTIILTPVIAWWKMRVMKGEYTFLNRKVDIKLGS